MGQRGTQLRVVVDGRPGPWWDELALRNGLLQDTPYPGLLAWSNNRPRTPGPRTMSGWLAEEHDQAYTLCYAARRGTEYHVVLGEVVGPALAQVGAADVFSFSGMRHALSADGQHLAYGAHLPDGQTVVVVDGVPGPDLGPLRGLPRTYLSPDSRHVAYLMVSALKVGYVVYAGSPYGPCTRVDYLRFSPDSQHLAWTAESAGQRSLFVDGQRRQDVPPDATVVGWTADSHEPLLVMPATNERRRLWRAGRSDPAYSGILDFYLPSVGSAVAYRAVNNPFPWLDMLVEKCWPSVFQRPSLAGPFPGRHFLVVNGQPGPAADALIGPARWSADGRHVASVVAYFGDHPSHLVVRDTAPGPRVRTVAVDGEGQYTRSLYFLPDGALQYLAVQDGRLYRFTHHPARGDGQAE